jgi:hypothetical protein
MKPRALRDEAGRKALAYNQATQMAVHGFGDKDIHLSKATLATNQQPKNQPNPRRTELRHGAFCGFFECGASWAAVIRYLPPKAELFGRPRAVAGRERAPGPARRAKWTKKWFALDSWVQRDLAKTS